MGGALGIGIFLKVYKTLNPRGKALKINVRNPHHHAHHLAGVTLAKGQGERRRGGEGMPGERDFAVGAWRAVCS